MNAVTKSPVMRDAAKGEEPAGASASPAPKARRPLKERLRLPLMVGVPVLVGLGGGYYYVAAARYQETDDAYLRAAQVTISPNVAGRVSEVDVHDNQVVHVGETLFKIDDRPFQIAVEEAQARLGSARLSVEALKANYHQHQADLRTAQSALDYALREFDRQTRLLASGISSQAQLDRALAARNEAQGRVGSVQQEITATLASLGGDPNIPAARHPMVLAAQAALDRAKLNLSYTVITAPIEGIVTRVEQLQAGNYIKDAAPAFALVSTHDVWVEANFKEVQLTHMKVGQLATVRFDAYPGHDFRARVSSVSPGTGSEFSLLPPENASGNWVKVVQRLPVRFELEEQVPATRSGISALVTVDTKSLEDGKRLQTAGAATGS